MKLSQEQLDKYAKVMVDFAAGATKGIKKGDIVLVQYEQISTPLALSVQKRILEKGGYPIVRSIDYRFTLNNLKYSNEDQLKFFPEKYSKSLVDTIDHRIYIMANEDPQYLKDIDPKKIMLSSQSKKKMREWLDKKEDAGNLTWTLCLYPTQAMAKEAGLSLEEYWVQISKACFLEEPDPIEIWKDTYKQIEKIKTKLNKLEVDRFHIVGKNTNLYIKLGTNRKFISGKGSNIPSFEIFTSPDWRGTEGYISFDMPLYRYGNVIKDIYLEFKEGRVVKAKASKNEKLLLEMIKQDNADKVGEFSLTDKRFSKIDKFMAETLFDENYGGKYGNTHIALGASYHDTFNGDVKKVKKNQWKSMGFNESVEHCDIIQTENRQVFAELKKGKTTLIYSNGEFKI